MNGLYGIATPKSEAARAKMKAKIGRDHFFFKVEPTDCMVQVEHGNVPGLRWDFTALDPMIRIALTVDTSRQHQISINAADLFLMDTGACFISADFDLTYTDEMPDNWADTYPVFQRKATQS